MFFRSLIKPILVFVVLLAAMAQPAFAQSSNYGSSIQQEVINGVVQNIIQSVRDQLQRRRVVPPTPSISRFSGEESDFNNRDPFAAKGVSNPFSALAYAKAPLMVAPGPVWLYGANLIGSADKSQSFNSDTNVETITGAFDVTKIGIFTTSDALTFIGTGSHSWSHNVTGIPAAPAFIIDGSIPSSSGTVSYLNGGFSADFTALASWTRNSASSLLVATPDSSTVAYTGNAQYRFDFPYATWIEPTAGVTYTEVFTANFGTKLADLTEVHGGARIGTEMKWMGYTVQPTLSGSVFKVVDANVSLNPLALLVPAAVAPLGTLGGRGSAKMTVLWTPNFSSYLEAHASGVSSTKTFQPPGVNPASTNTVGAQAGLRYSWN